MENEREKLRITNLISINVCVLYRRYRHTSDRSIDMQSQPRVTRRIRREGNTWDTYIQPDGSINTSISKDITYVHFAAIAVYFLVVMVNPTIVGLCLAFGSWMNKRENVCAMLIPGVLYYTLFNMRKTPLSVKHIKHTQTHIRHKESKISGPGWDNLYMENWIRPLICVGFSDTFSHTHELRSHYTIGKYPHQLTKNIFSQSF